jgi:hypothetical protein
MGTPPVLPFFFFGGALWTTLDVEQIAVLTLGVPMYRCWRSM